jgi:hypothetical protein
MSPYRKRAFYKLWFRHLSEDEKLKIDIYRSDAEKLQLFKNATQK